jgi:hypothetical protein
MKFLDFWRRFPALDIASFCLSMATAVLMLAVAAVAFRVALKGWGQ